MWEITNYNIPAWLLWRARSFALGTKVHMLIHYRRSPFPNQYRSERRYGKVLRKLDSVTRVNIISQTILPFLSGYRMQITFHSIRQKSNYVSFQLNAVDVVGGKCLWIGLFCLDFVEGSYQFPPISPLRKWIMQITL